MLDNRNYKYIASVVLKERQLGSLVFLNLKLLVLIKFLKLLHLLLQVR